MEKSSLDILEKNTFSYDIDIFKLPMKCVVSVRHLFDIDALNDQQIK